ncbi:hypothetical protein J1N35_026987 [Gossypium stocksii]|uniref:Sulfotransferase n=1 Tax=Gossypium stocksii TaxID=47602 RepID=A0A9D3ZZB3_9ROSI|nr:hypothetical protein J1N35_026987 [Gossypium stocksii]
MKEVARSYFQKLFSTEHNGSYDYILSGIDRCISDEDNMLLTAECTKEEIQKAVSEMGSMKAPGEDGIPGLFYQKCWHIIGSETTKFCLQLLNGNMEPLFPNYLHSLIMESHFDSHVEQDNEDEFQNSFKEMISTLPKGNSWGFPDHLYQYQGFWLTPPFLQGVMLAQEQFEAQPTDIILCSAPRTGTAWLKSLTFATMTRTSYDDSTTPLHFKMPHDVVPFMELDHAHFSANRHLGIPLLATHAPYSFLPTSIIDSGCKIIYICRDPKDTFVSLYHICTRYAKSKNTQPIELDEAFELFCEGVNWYGPYWDHVLGYWKARLEHPDKFLFLKYEEMNEDTVFYLKKLAEFMGCAFSSEEQQEGVPEKIVKMCSFENISNLEVNKSGKHREGQGNLVTENKIYFRKGKSERRPKSLSASVDSATSEQSQKEAEANTQENRNRNARTATVDEQ